jgi:hypothetical protein
MRKLARPLISLAVLATGLVALAGPAHAATPMDVVPWRGVWFAIEDPVGTNALWYVQHAIVCVPFAA